MSAYEDLYLELETEYLSEAERRDFRREARGRIVGGGFGVSGAAQGIITAGAINMATGFAHSMFNSIGNAITKYNMNEQADKIYYDSSILDELSGKLGKIIDHIGTILWKNILKVNYNNDRNIKLSEDIYKNLIDGLIPVDKVPKVLPALVYDLWAFYPDVFTNKYVQDIDPTDKAELMEIYKLLDVNNSSVKAELYMHEHQIPEQYFGEIVDMFNGCLDAAYKISYLLNDKERKIIINDLKEKGYERVFIADYLDELNDIDIDEVSPNAIDFLQKLVADTNLFYQLFDVEHRPVFLALLRGNLPELHYEKIYGLSRFLDPKLNSLLIEEGLFDFNDVFKFLKKDKTEELDQKDKFVDEDISSVRQSNINKAMDFPEITNPEICFNLYEAIKGMKLLAFKPMFSYEAEIENYDSKSKDDTEDKFDFSLGLNSFGEVKKEDIILLGSRWSVEEREYNAKYWLKQAADKGYQKAIDILLNESQEEKIDNSSIINNHTNSDDNDTNINIVKKFNIDTVDSAVEYIKDIDKDELLKVTKKGVKSILGFTIDGLERIKRSL
ncbi:hypothetical protein DWZ94_01035 [Veillonella atypica]|nr:hypothetical protein DWZ94_01035 [Veillonella atypica]